MGIEGVGDFLVQVTDFRVGVAVVELVELLLAEFEFAFLDSGHALTNGVGFVFVEPASDVAEGFVTVGIVVVEGEFELLAFEDADGGAREVGFASGGSIDEFGAGGGGFRSVIDAGEDFAALFEAVEVGARDLDIELVFEQFGDFGKGDPREEPIGEFLALVLGEGVDAR